MKKIVHALFAIALLFCTTNFTHAQKDKNKGVMFTTSSNEALSYFNEGLKFYDIVENTKAREQLDKAILQDPTFAAAYIYRATLANSPQEFVSNLDKAKEHLSSSNDWEKLLYDYIETYLSDNSDKRLTIGQKMVVSFPSDARACTYLGQAYESRNDFTNARKCYQKAVSLAPYWAGGYVALANSYLFEDPKDFKQAEKAANKVVDLAPFNASYILLGDTYRAQNDLKKAADMYSKAIMQDAQLPVAYMKRGHVYSFTGEFEKARTDYEKGGSLDVVPTGARVDIALTYLYQNEPEKALESLQNDIDKIASTLDAANVNQFKYDLLTTSAQIAMHLRDAQKLEEIVKMLQPLSEDVGMRVGTQEAKLGEKAGILFWEGVIQLLKNDISGATQKADEIKTTVETINNPLKLNGYDFLSGYIAMQQKDYQNAVNHFEKTNKLDIYKQYCLAKAYEANGQKDKANAIFKYLANYNFNDVGYALIRNEVKKKM